MLEEAFTISLELTVKISSFNGKRFSHHDLRIWEHINNVGVVDGDRISKKQKTGGAGLEGYVVQAVLSLP